MRDQIIIDVLLVKADLVLLPALDPERRLHEDHRGLWLRYFSNRHVSMRSRSIQCQLIELHELEAALCSGEIPALHLHAHPLAVGSQHIH